MFRKHFPVLLLFLIFTVYGFAQSFSGDSGHLENTPLYFGNPSDALPVIESENNYLLEKKQFTISYNNLQLIPNWTGWHLSESDIGESGRSNSFIADAELPEGWYRVNQKDYRFSLYGFDRGHLCPSADRTSSVEDNKMTFLMTNMVPQAPDNNRIIWNHLEAYERELVKQGNELYIFAGGAGTGGTGNRGYFEEIPVQTADGELKINVPACTWKVILILSEGENDFDRINEETLMIAVCVPNEQGCGEGKNWQDYVCTVNYIEELTGFDFFELLEDGLEELLENRVIELSNE